MNPLMNYEEFVSDLPLQSRISFSSVEESREELKQRYGINQQIWQLSAGAFQSDLIIQNTEEVNLLSRRFNTAFSMYLEAPVDTVGLAIFKTPGNALFASGEDAANDKLVFIPAGEGVDFISSGLVGSESIVIPYTHFIEISEAVCPAPKSVWPKKMAVIKGNTEKLNLFREAIHNLIIQPDLLNHEEQLSNLIAELIDWMCQTSKQWRPEGFAIKSSKQHIARQTRDYLEDNISNTIHMKNVCSELGVGLRTMYRCFTEYFQMTPYYYLKMVRLNKIHNELLASNSKHHFITDIAHSNGVTHMGRFSNEYKKMFEELPSATMKRRN